MGQNAVVVDGFCFGFCQGNEQGYHDYDYDYDDEDDDEDDDDDAGGGDGAVYIINIIVMSHFHYAYVMVLHKKILSLSTKDFTKQHQVGAWRTLLGHLPRNRCRLWATACQCCRTYWDHHWWKPFLIYQQMRCPGWNKAGEGEAKDVTRSESVDFSRFFDAASCRSVGSIRKSHDVSCLFFVRWLRMNKPCRSTLHDLALFRGVCLLKTYLPFLCQRFVWIRKLAISEHQIFKMISPQPFLSPCKECYLFEIFEKVRFSEMPGLFMSFLSRICQKSFFFVLERSLSVEAHAWSLGATATVQNFFFRAAGPQTSGSLEEVSSQHLWLLQNLAGLCPGKVCFCLLILKTSHGEGENMRKHVV